MVLISRYFSLCRSHHLSHPSTPVLLATFDPDPLTDFLTYDVRLPWLVCQRHQLSSFWEFPSRELKRRDCLFLPDPPTLRNGYSTATGVGRFPPGAPHTSRFQSFSNVGGYAASLSPHIQSPRRQTAQSPVTGRSHQKRLERPRAELE